MFEKLQQLYPERVIIPQSVSDIPKIGYMVYVLVFNGIAIVVGCGQKNRAKVIFDNENNITRCHIKALFVRLYILFGNGNFERYFIACENKEEAKEIETKLHNEIKGNIREIPVGIRNQLFHGINLNSITYLLLEIAIRSSFDGLSDIRKWHKDGIIRDEVWNEISQKLQLHKIKRIKNRSVGNDKHN